MYEVQNADGSLSYQYTRGFPVGFASKDDQGKTRYYLNNHLRLTILMHPYTHANGDGLAGERHGRNVWAAVIIRYTTYILHMFPFLDHQRRRTAWWVSRSWRCHASPPWMQPLPSRHLH